jgi:hypothetical protein
VIRSHAPQLVASAIVIAIAVSLGVIFFNRSAPVATGPALDSPRATVATPVPAVPQPPELAVTRSGDGTMQSPTFALRGGAYELAWALVASAVTDDRCTAKLDLASEDPPYRGQVVEADVSGRQFGTSFVSNVLPGASFSIDATSTCRWIVTVSPVGQTP